ncbi:uncharacterized protein Z520_11044 [Fonsecaea multimorphosa CBS 102226]|uniref:Uncharacterized protein n=1 Tax=Fonsecaea multimorphosa CBS 102226 TaxID=1442371 RepID=A0A0D2GUH5_9EURO|nr:uncharacterized protein Z520_11044 [Fonsecaea multimorphosa CBS 102226]KIX93190.1 hypothetical protein Z520_11044 [Fonsecaea multimorphosa CBS 102226]OAL18428.1 hypothetical protein AYO22_10624 [Fonsecaea multimorphosa]
MHSALSFLTGGRQLKGRLFPWSKPAPKTDGFVPKKSPSVHLSRLSKHGREKWAYPAKPTEDVAGRDPGGLSSNSKASSDDVKEQRQEQEATGDGNGQQETALGDPRVIDCIATLQRQQDINAQVLAQVFELNAIRAPMFQQTEDVVDSLKELLHQVTDLTKSADLPDHLTAQLGDIQRKFDLFCKGPFASFRADEAKCAHLENDIIQSLFHSGRRLDRVLDTNADKPAVFPESETIMSLADEQEDLGDGPAERSPEDIQYLSTIGDRDMILELLSDLRGEQRQLLEEQKSRAHFGLSLDEDSLRFLDTFDHQEQVLLDELEYAELGLEALKQLMADDEALAISNEALEREPDEDQGAMRYLEREMLLSHPISLPSRRAMQSPLYQGILHRKIRLVDHLRGPDMIPVDPGDFVNVWLLQRLQSLPRLLGEYASLTETQYAEIEDDDLEDLFLEKWFNDSTAADFAKHRTFADQQSMQANLAESGNLEQRSLSAVPVRPTSIPLLRLGDSTTAKDIITQAMQAQGILSPPLSDT